MGRVVVVRVGEMARAGSGDGSWMCSNLRGEQTRFANDIQEQRVPSSRAQCILLSPDVDTFTPELRGPLCLQQSLAQSLGSTMLPPLSAR